MRFAEVFLRLGCSLVAWMVLYAYFVWLAALHAMGCGPDGDEMHKLLFGLAPIALGLALMLRVTGSFPEIHRILGWLGVPLALLLPFVVNNIWIAFSKTSVQGLSICTNAAPARWQILWAPAQLMTVVVIALLVVREWRKARI